MELFLKTLLVLTLAGTALALILMLLNRILGKRIYSSFIYFAWLLVLLRFILPAPGLLSVPAATPVSRAAVEPQAVGNAAPEAPRSYSAETNPNPGGTAAEVPQPSADAPDVPESATWTETGTPAAKEGERAKLPAWTLMFCLWATGTVCAAGWNLCGYFRYRRALFRTLRPTGERDALTLNTLHPLPWPALYRSDAVTTPLLLGLVRPIIVLPDRAYTPEMLDGILRHELTHYRRGDLAVKWFAAAVFCVHWFNPLVYLFRAELDRACELSCDERLLRDMDRDEKQHYGELLLTLAADRPLPRRVVAVSFATEKRNLKERLMQIMTFKKKGWAAFTIMLVVLALLVGCAVAMGPAAVTGAQSETEKAALLASEKEWETYAREWNPESTVSAALPEITAAPGFPLYEVHTVDEFLSSLGSNRVLLLHAGEYNLTEASDYGDTVTREHRYQWMDTQIDGYELQIHDVEHLTIFSEDGAGAVSIVTEPRYANVLRFESCSDVTIQGVTAGHTPEQGSCTGGVLNFQSCDDVSVNESVLYGCGTVGISAFNCRRVFAERTTIKECSFGGIRADNSYDVRFVDGKIYDCGLKSGCYSLIESHETTGFVVFNTAIYDNDAQLFLSSSYSNDVELRGCRVYGNQFGQAIRIEGGAALIDGCSLSDNAIVTGMWYVDPEHPAVDRNGNALAAEDLTAMEWTEYPDVYDGPPVMDTTIVSFRIGEDGREEVHVSTVDEFLVAIGSNRVIYLDAELFDLSSASNYGGYGGTHYYWRSNYDGPGLVISGVENLSIVGLGYDKTNIETLPRYADVLSFLDCYGVTVQDLTAGHTLGAGACSGDVISFQNCADCTVLTCGLFGCGVNGINAYRCQNLTVQETIIYECSGYGAVIQDCYNTAFAGCSIRDCEYNKIWVRDGSDVTWDGKPREDVPEMFTAGQA